jgi:hypothetical protein
MSCLARVQLRSNASVFVHGFEIYPGTHTSYVGVRFQDHVMPFFSRTLSFEQPRR